MDAAVERLQEALGYAEKIGPIEEADTYGDLAELYIRRGVTQRLSHFLSNACTHFSTVAFKMN